MDWLLLRKSINQCLTDYFGSLDVFPLTEEEYDKLCKVSYFEINKVSEEDVYTIVHDHVYTYYLQTRALLGP